MTSQLSHQTRHDGTGHIEAILGGYTMTSIARLGALCAALLMPMAAAADEAEIGKAVSIELNAIKDGDNSCALTFMVINGHDQEIGKAVYETVLFDGQGQVDRLTLFDFGTLPPGRPRVRQFSVGGMTCANLGQILINGSHTCDGTDLVDGACEKGLQLNSRTDVEVIG
ncbi:MAG: hypothetical protein AAFZ04_03915 [Pseudomonadota bacterium]